MNTRCKGVCVCGGGGRRRRKKKTREKEEIEEKRSIYSTGVSESFCGAI